MINNTNIINFIRENRTAFILILVVLFLIELEVFAFAVMKSGRKSLLQITDSNGVLVHETDGNNLSEFDKYYFERTFGPFKNYEARLEVTNKPFPFRAWFVAALGIPIGSVLLLAFIFNVYLTIFQIKNTPESSRTSLISSDYENNFDIFLKKISNMNIFIVGFLVFLAVIAYWIVPNAISYIGKTGIDTITRFKWVFIFIISSVVLIGLWIVYLRYCLVKRDIESRTEIEKHRLSLYHLDPNVHLPQMSSDDSYNIKNEGVNSERNT